MATLKEHKKQEKSLPKEVNLKNREHLMVSGKIVLFRKNRYQILAVNKDQNYCVVKRIETSQVYQYTYKEFLLCGDLKQSK